MGRGRGDTPEGTEGLLEEIERGTAAAESSSIGGFQTIPTNELKTELAADKTYKERKEFVRSKLRQLDEDVAALVQNPDKLKELLGRSASFPNYSWNNVTLILAQNPRASRCANYETWQKMGRQVKKMAEGESGLRVFRPVEMNIWDPEPSQTNPATGQLEKRFIYRDPKTKKWVTVFASDLQKPEVQATVKAIKNPKDKPREKRVKRMKTDAAGNPTDTPVTYMDFRLVPTFDISQTEPIPGHEYVASEGAQKALDELRAVCAKRGITVVIAGSEDSRWGQNLNMLGDANREAYWNADKSEIVLRDGDLDKMVGDLAHEMAHQDLGHRGKKDGIDPQVKEAQAEATAYAVCSYYGIDRSSFSPTYIAGWAKEKPEAVREVLHDVHEAFRRIMKDAAPEEEAAEERKTSYKRKSSRSRRPAAKK